MNIIYFGFPALVIVAVVYLVGKARFSNARRRSTSHQQSGYPEPTRIDFVVLEADSPAISTSRSLAESVGVEVSGGAFAPLLKRDARLPSEEAFNFTTYEDNQREITVQFYRGNAEQIRDNTFIAKVVITGFAAGAKRGEPQVRVTVKAADGKLSIAAIDGKTRDSLKPAAMKDADPNPSL